MGDLICYESDSIHEYLSFVSVLVCKGEGVIIPSKMSHLCSPEDIEDWCFDMVYIDTEIYEEKLEFSEVVKLTGNNVMKVDGFLEMLEVENNSIVIEEKLIDLLIELEEDTQQTSRTPVGIDKFSCHDIFRRDVISFSIYWSCTDSWINNNW